jgi:anti-sigma regulatory factor (Ser/Thr protein kinase)
MPSASGDGCPHAALLYDSAEGLAAVAVPFLADGLAAGEAVVVACREEHSALLAELLGTHDRIVSLQRDVVYTRSAEAVATFRHVVHRQVAAGAPRVRLLSEVPVDRWAEWHRYEAVFNVAMAPLPLWSVCAYDARALPRSILDGVEETHPALMTAAGRLTNDRYVDPAAVLRRTSSVPVDVVEDTPPTLDVADLADSTRLAQLRAQVRAALDGSPAQQHRRGDFGLAVGEVLANAFRHGCPPVAVRLWVTPTRLVCTVTDHGAGFDDPLAGYDPPGIGSAVARSGLWLVRQTCDALDAVRTPSGFTVRLTAVLAGAGRSPDTAHRTPDAAAEATRIDRARTHARELARRFTLA